MTTSKPNSDLIPFVVLYDIQDDKTRTTIFKYLQKQGGHNIQRSVFLGSTSRQNFKEMCSTLKEIAEIWGNEDSIIVFPLAQDILSAMLVYGQAIDLDLLLGRKRTVFF